jgi:phosphomethylpyrimidine synthase
MRVTDNIRQRAPEQGLAEDEALKEGMGAKSKEFAEKGAEA